jgi:hypothetical protein
MASYNYNNKAYDNGYPPFLSNTIQNKKIQNYVLNINEVLGTW